MWAGDKAEHNLYKASTININNNPLAAEPQVGDRQTYLQELFQRCNLLPLAAMKGEEDTSAEIGLDRVYTRLDTTARVKLTEAEKAGTQKARAICTR